MPLLWHIDDGQHLLAVSAATAARTASWRFEGFLTGQAAVAAFAQREADQRPDAILMDYFIGDERGDTITRALRRLDPWPGRSLVIGHSSVHRASEAIVAAGGNLILRKYATEAGLNPALLTWLLERDSAA